MADSANVATKVIEEVEREEVTETSEEPLENVEYEVEEILDHGTEKGKDLYFVKWKGYPPEDNTWEPKSNLNNCTKLLKRYHKRLREKKSNGADITKKRHLSNENLKESKKKKMKVTRSLSDPSLTDEERRSLHKKLLRRWENELNNKCSDPASVKVINRVDLEGPPQNFMYINEYIPGPGILIPNDPLIGCECTNCFENSESCCPTLPGAKFAYNRYGRIRVPPGKPVFECNRRCKCGPKCPNRVVQAGRKCRVCIFKTANGCGWGVKTLDDIKRNSFVMEYVGEVISNEEAERRGKIYDSNGRTYLFDLDYDSNQDCAFVVDAGFYGNVSHFVNHSCDPNMVVYGVWI
ncbi:histone-lysine N-methyltransferase SUV39H2-like, partial [Saccoglossus kowalevskii]|uniref:Histone-lysine N-methyltransferase n=1 Tax=Saccoglossus kowalevskii TaxID=10224 RepID=A0ABM0GPU1_SACKO